MDQRTLQPANDLLPLVYNELRRLAAGYLRNRRSGRSIQATALVHEAYIRMTGNGDPGWESQAHFFGSAARAMRQILCDWYRRKKAPKHGGLMSRVELDDRLLAVESNQLDYDRLDQALLRLEAMDQESARIAELRIFAGLTVSNIAQMFGWTEKKVEHIWLHARACLRRDLGCRDGG